MKTAFIWFCRGLLGLLAVAISAGLGLMAWMAYQDFPESLYAILIAFGLVVAVFVMVNLYCWCEETRRKKPEESK